MAFFHQYGSRKPVAEINVVPFIDVMLVLLVIFMITTPLLTQGVKIDLPKTESKALPPNQKEPIIVSVDSEGKYFLNISHKPDQAITARVLSQLVQAEITEGTKSGALRTILVRGDKNANYGKIVEAMVLLQEAGAKSVGLITQPQQKSEKTG